MATVLLTRCRLRQSLLLLADQLWDFWLLPNLSTWRLQCAFAVATGRESEGLSQRRVKGSRRVRSFGPKSSRHAEVSIINTVFGVHSHCDQWVVFSPLFFWPISRASLHLCWLETLLLHVTRSGRIWTGRCAKRSLVGSVCSPYSIPLTKDMMTVRMKVRASTSFSFVVCDFPSPVWAAPVL